MNKRILLSALFLGLLMSLSACTAIIPHSVTGNAGRVTKVGKATCEHVFGFEYGNCGFLKAKKNGGINSVSHVDIEVSNYLVYGMRETRVYGD